MRRSYERRNNPEENKAVTDGLSVPLCESVNAVKRYVDCQQTQHKDRRSLEDVFAPVIRVLEREQIMPESVTLA